MSLNNLCGLFLALIWTLFAVEFIQNQSMFKRILVIGLVITGLLSQQTKADEGMWLPLLVKRLNHADMKKMGCKLSAEEIYSVNKSSLKDAVVMLSGGSCTAEAISSEGLLLTNHHCGYEAIQSN